ncbi:hypothetical protein NDA17_007437 [Ustilago hordei]|nr:hypothetical protein NDA17_007437 [Ustilago hordei]
MKGAPVTLINTLAPMIAGKVGQRRSLLSQPSWYTVEHINIASGEVCQEETIRDYATFVNIADGQPEKGNEPVFDYKMKDIHYVLLPQLADYLIRYNATSASDAATESLPRRALLQNGTAYRELLYANVQYVLNSSAAFVQDPSDHKNLARIKADNPVGNWRDSNISLGWGVYPVDVSTALVPAALYAISDTAKARLMQNFTSKSTNITESDLAETAERYATVWEQEAPKFFQYNVTSDQAQERLQGYVQRANLSDSLLYGLGSLNGSSSCATSVEQQQQRLCWWNAALLGSRPSLLTNVGMLVTNPAYDPNTTKTTELDRATYHGTFLWGFQTNSMASGLDRIIASCDSASTRTEVEKSSLNE